MSTQTRVIGFDIARSLAIFGMVIVNFKIAMAAETGSAFWLGFASLFEGRASALFVILAGIGISLMSAHTRLAPTSEAITSTRIRLLKRAALLFIVGIAYTPIWPADILHFYGVYFVIATALCFSSNRTLLFASLSFIVGFFGLLITLDYDKGWQWSTLTYTDLWTWQGMMRHLIFNGFHPVFPWCAFLLFGMWLGRQPLTQPSMQKQLAKTAFIVLVGVETGLFLMRYLAVEHLHISPEVTQQLLTSSIIPPLPQYMVSAASSAVLMLMACLWFGQHCQQLWLAQWLYRTGQVSLTLYIAHVLIGMGTLEAFNLLNAQAIETALLSALIYCVSATVFSVVWLHFFKLGPCEWLFKKIAS